MYSYTGFADEQSRVVAKYEEFTTPDMVLLPVVNNTVSDTTVVCPTGTGPMYKHKVNTESFLCMHKTDPVKIIAKWNQAFRQGAAQREADTDTNSRSVWML